MLASRLEADELMDDPALAESTYHAVLSDLAKVNRLTLAYRPTLGFLRRAVGDRKKFSLLDVGFGDGDMLRRIARWAARRGIEADLTGIDLNDRSLAAAQAHESDLPIRYLAGDYHDLKSERFDFIVSSLVAHHMSHEQLVSFLRFMDREAATGWFVNDLHRHGFAHAGYPVLARLMGWHRVVRLDGTMSIARSYRPGEWPPLLVEAGVSGASVRRFFPFRLCVEKIH
ncbi:methyltransferase domain-containing protein [Tsuneonella sp. HG222]